MSSLFFANMRCIYSAGSCIWQVQCAGNVETSSCQSQWMRCCAEYDLGERFDLKAKYCDNGWVDEDAAFGKQVARFFGLGKKKQDDGSQDDKKGRKK